MTPETIKRLMLFRLVEAKKIPDLRLMLVYQDGTDDSLEVLLDDAGQTIRHLLGIIKEQETGLYNIEQQANMVCGLLEGQKSAVAATLHSFVQGIGKEAATALALSAPYAELAKEVEDGKL